MKQKLLTLLFNLSTGLLLMTLSSSVFAQTGDHCTIKLNCNGPITQHIYNTSQQTLYWSVDDPWDTQLVRMPLEVTHSSLAPKRCSWLIYQLPNKDTPAVGVSFRALQDEATYEYHPPAACQFRFLYNAQRHEIDGVVNYQYGAIHCSCDSNGQLIVRGK